MRNIGRMAENPQSDGQVSLAAAFARPGSSVMAAADTGAESAVPRRHRQLGVPSNLPAEASSFVGRHEDIACAGRLLAAGRLLTLTGAGGCGKTRLAERVARETARRFPAGVWWVELAALTDGGLAADALARTLELPVEGRSAAEVVVEHLADQVALVALDNCEHVVDAVADFADRLLRGCRDVHVLATSRQPLGVEGETTWRVPSMAIPPAAVDRTALTGFDAARLLLERIRQARPEAIPGEDRADAVTEICRRLDGIPLALELAAARARTMTLDRIALELDDRFRLLTGGPRAGLARHQTLLASVQWSHDLLAEDERTLLRRLAVFVGGFRIAAAEAVAGFAPLSPEAVLPLLARVVDCSLVQFDDRSGRYRLLDTIREYARERLRAADETREVADRHLAWACALAEQLDPAMTRAELDTLDEMEAELPNLRTALDHAAAIAAPAEEGLRLAAALAFFWAQRGLGIEGADRALRVLDAHPDAPRGARARAWAAAAYDRFYGGDFDRAAAEADSGLVEARFSRDVYAEARCRHVQGAIAFLLDPPACRSAMAEAITLAQASGDRWCETDALQFLAFSHLIQHRPAPAQEPMMRSCDMADAEGNAFQQACHQLGLGMTAAAGARLADAATACRRGADGAQRIGDPVIELWGRAGEATAMLALGRFSDLDRIAVEATRLDRPLPPVVDTFVAGLRRIARADEHPVDALAALLDVAELLRTTFVPNEGMRMALIGAAGALGLGEVALARVTAETVHEHAEAFGSALTGPCRVLLGRLRRRAGEPIAAQRLIHDGLSEILDAGLLVDLPDALEALGGIALDVGSTAESARLLAAASDLRTRWQVPGAYPTEAGADRLRLTDVLGEDFANRWHEGERLGPEAAVAYARRARGERKRPAFGWEALTPTEAAVARLAAEGLSNPAIGERLFVARGTVKSHLEQVYAKLGVHNRTELAATSARRST